MKLIYSALASLDGYIEDESGSFEWAAPDAELHAFINELERPLGTYLYGRRMYETMRYWETMDGDSPIGRDFAELWRAADKVVYSRSLEAVDTTRTRLEREFDADAVRELKVTAERDLGVGGPELAAQAIAAGLVDELHLYLLPVVVGGGKRALPRAHLQLELIDERRFRSGAVFLHYRLSR